MTKRSKFIDETRRKILLGSPMLVGLASASILSACKNDRNSSSLGATTGGTISAVQAPTFSPTGGTYSSAQTVSLSTPTSGATIHFTTDGSDPTQSSSRYTSPFTVLASTSVRAIAAAPGLGTSPVGSATYAIKSATTGYDGMISVSGASLVNGSKATVQLRGTNIQNYAQAFIVGNADASGAITGGNDQANGPNIEEIKKWKMNAIRIGINEASWLGYESYTTAVNGDRSTGWIKSNRNGGAKSYVSQITKQIEALNSAGCYVILTLAFSNPGRSAALGQDYMANQDNSIQCWQSIAETYGYPNGTALKRNGGTVDDGSVIFELYNEPAMYGEDSGNWHILMNGGLYKGAYFANYYGALGLPYTSVYPYPCESPSGPGFIPGEHLHVDGRMVGKVLCYYRNTTSGLPSSGTQFVHIFNSGDTEAPGVSHGDTVRGTLSGTTAYINGHHGWYVAGHAQMLASIRAAGARNVCLLSGDQYNQDLSGWAAYAPGDSVAPAGYNGSAWEPQIGASWHPYPTSSYIHDVVVANGGSDYAVGDSILLPMPESGSAANSVYWQAMLEVTAVNGSAIRAVRIKPYTGGTPGVAGGNAGQFSSHSSGGSPVGGAYSNLLLPTNPVPQYSSSGRGSGAAFALSFKSTSGNNWPNTSHWPAVAALATTPGVPVVITETGEHYGTGVAGSPWMSALTAWCDQNGISLVAYAYTPSSGWTNLQGGDFSLADRDHVPTPGYGAFMYNWFTTHS